MSLLHINDKAGQYPDSWYAATTDALAPFDTLNGTAEADLCIVGGGYTGLSAALHAAQAGLKVVLLEAQRVGFGASGRNGGQIGSGFNKDVDWLVDRMGRDAAHDLWRLSEEGKALIRRLIADHAPAAQYRPGILYAEYHAGDVAVSHSMADHLSFNYDYGQMTKMDSDQIATMIGSDVFKGGVLDEGAGYCHPLRLALGLARAAAEAGAVLYERSEVQSVTAGMVKTASGQVKARHILLACNGYMPGLNRKVAARVMPLNNYIAVTEPLGDRTPMIRPIAVADGKSVVNYWWQTDDGRLVYGGGESYGKRFPKNIRAKVRRNLAQVYPRLADVTFSHAWGGTLAVTATRLPHLAEVIPGVFSASGYSGHGVALSVLCGKLVVEAAGGTRDRFDLMASLPTPALPGGSIFGPAIANLGMMAFGLRDRLGI
ncbi:NAD(P)/FAD-dependent oxidoreductase [Parasulfitobacter algicola]|uniref:FAD-binding oxidoreductase n=1 Tax=Parasulfitobacter algicola TaxID=2614809 RepID=A0ABX2IV81_9RHOB|nr:FAD-binding oxidoreductase [Sulfitobacter algicola]NSX54742.1 FAD-binding oxidoreductase [Sulfitobacter algicola]